MTEAGSVRPGRRDPAAIAAALEAWLPSRLGADTVQVRDLTAPKGAGFSNETYLFQAETPRGLESLVLQAPPARPGLLPRTDIAAMARIQTRLGPASSGGGSLSGKPSYFSAPGRLREG